MSKPFEPPPTQRLVHRAGQLRLVIQASIPLSSAAEGDAEYENLKVFLLVISPDITLNGQIVKILEPCCKKKPEPKDHEKDAKIPE